MAQGQVNKGEFQSSELHPTELPFFCIGVWLTQDAKTLPLNGRAATQHGQGPYSEFIVTIDPAALF